MKERGGDEGDEGVGWTELTPRPPLFEKKRGGGGREDGVGWALDGHWGGYPQAGSGEGG
jgi:hypothetical protein